MQISVVIPTYNRAELVRLTLESVFAQTHSNFEVLLIDDGSTDGTKDVLKEFQGLQNFSYHYQTNSGRSVARNRGLAMAQGEFVMFLDSDDLLAKSALENLLAAAEQNPDSGVVAGSRRFVDESDIVLDVKEPMPFSGSFSARRIYGEKIRDLFICMGSFIIKKEVADSLGGFRKEFEPAEDFDFFCRYCDITPVTLIAEPVIYIRHHGGNTSMRRLHEASVKITKNNIQKIRDGQLEYPSALKREILGKWYMRLADDQYNLNEKKIARKNYLSAVSESPGILFTRHGPHIARQIIATLF